MSQPSSVATEQHDRPSRQKLSCTSCHQRKVKCDRVKPCQACCARGRPYDCAYTNEEIRQPISQAQEIRRLRKVIQELTRGKIEPQDLIDGYIKLEDEDFADSPGSAESLADRQFFSEKPTRLKQWKSKIQEPRDSLFFGSPGMASIVDDFAKGAAGSRAASITHAIPRAVDIYAYPDAPLYPFPTFWNAQGGIAELLQCLPTEQEVLGYLQNYQTRARAYSFPHMPDDTTVEEIQRFLANLEENASRNPDMLALVFVTIALGVQEGAFDRAGKKWVEGAMSRDSWRGDIYIAASMQALRLASFTNRPTLLAIQTLVMICPYLINAGKFLDAWALFHLLVGLAHGIGLHRNPKLLHPSPPAEVCGLRQTLWWWILHMDTQMAATLGRPLCISGVGDCPPYEPLTADATTLRVGTYINQYTILTRQILSSGSLSNDKIDEFTDKLLELRDTLPDIVCFSETWLDMATPLPKWPFDAMATLFHCKTHNMLILLNRQRTSPSTNATSTAMNPSPRARGLSLVLSSCRSILLAFDFLYRRVPAALICWSLGQQAFNAAMILLLSMIETGDQRDRQVVARAYDIFCYMHRFGINKLACLAVEKMKDLCRGLEQSSYSETEESQLKTCAKEPVMGQTGMILLEDPGLQGFVGENFTPMNVKMAASNLSLNSVPMGGWAQASPHAHSRHSESSSPMMEERSPLKRRRGEAYPRRHRQSSLMAMKGESVSPEEQMHEYTMGMEICHGDNENYQRHHPSVMFATPRIAPYGYARYPQNLSPAALSPATRASLSGHSTPISTSAIPISPQMQLPHQTTPLTPQHPQAAQFYHHWGAVS
ncbi:MAG: hypothetical protein M1834_002500 [Cirrosporium novae-zelandiae]|nr:MAG: hypothetical protein M1834_002500 [Cirrosporium novae-zelandiae]